MDGKLWAQVYQTVMTMDHTESKRRAQFSDRVIALMVLRASYDERPLSWSCRPENWIGLSRPACLPSQSTASRRSRTEGVRALLKAVENWLEQRAPQIDRTLAVDGRPLTISPFSKDPDARWGYAIRGLGFGYKLHAIWGTGAVPLAWDLLPLNASEARVAAAALVPHLPVATGKRYLLGDASYDTNALYAAAAAQGFQLLSPPKNPGKGLGHRVHHPARIRGLEMLRTAYGKRQYRKRTVIERQYGNATMRDEGLGTLPAHVRRLPRVKLYVQAKLILNGFRILANRKLSLSPAA
jgi:hypothetical protein